jgi:uncharacterized RDD family membrane protein YckC
MSEPEDPYASTPNFEKPSGDPAPPAPGFPPPGAAYPPPAPNYPAPGQDNNAPSYPPPPAYGAAPAVPPGYGYGSAPMSVPQGMFYDPNSGLNLPVGTELASVGRRIGAYFLAIPLLIVTLGIGYVIWGLFVWGRGQTPALQVLGMRVWRPEENKVAGFGWMALREIVGRIADAILSVITYLVSFILFVTGKKRQSLHDLVASTVVLYDPNKVLATK